MNKAFLFIAGLLVLTAAGSAQTFDQASRSAQADLDNALQRYAQLQERIRAERIPLDRQLNELRSELQQARRESDRVRRIQDNSAVDLNAMRNRIERRIEQLDFVANLVTDYSQRFERDIDLSEQQIYTPAIERLQRAMEETLEEDDLLRARRLVGQLFIIQEGIGRFNRLIGGDTFEGRAIVAGGQVEEGIFINFGPTTFFASTESSTAGLALRTGLIPTAVPISNEADRSIRQVAVNGSGTLPIDPTLGSAFAIASQKLTLWEHIQQGGIWIWPILTFAFLAFATSLFKLYEIYSVKMPKPGSLHEILAALNDGRRDEALELAKAVDGPAREMLIDAVEHSEESKELIEEVMYERMLELQPRLERMLPFIAVTAATAPLMGLLGTVTGMINTFKLITIFGTGDAKQLSSGISEALVTTEFGLIVAIPSLIMHALLSRRAQAVMANMERMAVAFVNGLSRKN